MLPSPPIAETEYERNQKFNFVVSWLHSLRYISALGIFRDLSRSNNAAQMRVVEIGCAHAKLFSLLDEQFQINYTGIETDPACVDVARSRYGHKSNFSVVHASAATALCQISDIDIIVALETLEHIPEHDVVRIVEAVAAARPRLFVCSFPVEVGPAVWLKNIGSWLCGYSRHKEYRWAETLWAGLYRLDKLPPHAIGHKGFDWRWLAQTIRHNMRIIQLRKFPLRFLPAALGTSIFIVAEPRRGP